MIIDSIKNIINYLRSNKKGGSAAWILIALIIAAAIIIAVILYNQGQASKPVPFWYK